MEQHMAATFAYDLARFIPFRDKAACERARAITREQITRHPRKNVRIRVIEDEAAFAFAFAADIVARIKRAADEGRRRFVLILPAPNPQYAFVAHLINELAIPCGHVHTFNMDEYADQDGRSAPRGWRGGFQYWMWHDLFGRIRPDLAIPESQIHFPTSENVGDYSRMLEDLGGADVCYGGIGWAGHIAFVEPHVGAAYGDDLDGFLQLGTHVTELNPITICQNCLYADAGSAGDWSWTPPKAITIGPKDVAAAKLRCSWNGFGCGESVWQRFIVRLALHGPVTPAVPASILQLFETEAVLSGAVAADCSPATSERRVPIGFADRSE
jgi:glucosamine-6-phosphate deaminase